MSGPHLQPDSGGGPIGLDRDAMTLGRQGDNDLQIDDPTVSRHHARLERRGPIIYVQDLGSANGTYVNGTRISGLWPLNEGDTLRFGHTTFTLRGIASVGTPPPSSSNVVPPPPGPGTYTPSAPPLSSGAPVSHAQTSPPPEAPQQPYTPSTPPPQAGQPPVHPTPPLPSSPQVSVPRPPEVEATQPHAPSAPPPPRALPPFAPSMLSSPGTPGYAPGPPEFPGQAGSFPLPGPPTAPPSHVGAVLEPPGDAPIPLVRPHAVFGTDPSCDVVFADPSVAPRHAEIQLQGSGFILIDAGSPSGTLVNGQPVTAPHSLQSGDQIRIGRSVFYFRLPEPVPPPGFPLAGSPAGTR